MGLAQVRRTTCLRNRCVCACLCDAAGTLQPETASPKLWGYGSYIQRAPFFFCASRRSLFFALCDAGVNFSLKHGGDGFVSHHALLAARRFLFLKNKIKLSVKCTNFFFVELYDVVQQKPFQQSEVRDLTKVTLGLG